MELKIVNFYNLILKHKSFLIYAVFGVLTTCVNIFTFGICTKVGLVTFWANGIAWLLAVLFAYVTNRLWVFGSDKHTIKEIAREFLTFMICRLATGALDQFVMVFGVDYIGANYVPEKIQFNFSMLLKTASNGMVIILNYVFSKVVIFKKEKV